MSKKKKIEAAVRQLERENARQNTPIITITQDGITITSPPTFRVTQNDRSVGDIYYNLSEEEQLRVRQFYGMADASTEIYKGNTPKEFHPLICTRCGGNLAFKDDLLVCDYCGTTYSSNINIEEKKKGHNKLRDAFKVRLASKDKCEDCEYALHATRIGDLEEHYICSRIYGYEKEE